MGGVVDAVGDVFGGVTDFVGDVVGGVGDFVGDVASNIDIGDAIQAYIMSGGNPYAAAFAATDFDEDLGFNPMSFYDPVSGGFDFGFDSLTNPGQIPGSGYGGGFIKTGIDSLDQALSLAKSGYDLYNLYDQKQSVQQPIPSLTYQQTSSGTQVDPNAFGQGLQFISMSGLPELGSIKDIITSSVTGLGEILLKAFGTDNLSEVIKKYGPSVLAVIGGKLSYDDQKRINDIVMGAYNRYNVGTELKKLQYRTGEGIASLPVFRSTKQLGSQTTSTAPQRTAADVIVRPKAQTALGSSVLGGGKPINVDPNLIYDKPRPGMQLGGIMSTEQEQSIFPRLESLSQNLGQAEQTLGAPYDNQFNLSPMTSAITGQQQGYENDGRIGYGFGGISSLINKRRPTPRPGVQPQQPFQPIQPRPGFIVDPAGPRGPINPRGASGPINTFNSTPFPRGASGPINTFNSTPFPRRPIGFEFGPGSQPLPPMQPSSQIDPNLIYDKPQPRPGRFGGGTDFDFGPRGPINVDPNLIYDKPQPRPGRFGGGTDFDFGPRGPIFLPRPDGTLQNMHPAAGGIRPGVQPSGYSQYGPRGFGPMQGQGVGDPRLGAPMIPGNPLQEIMRGPQQAPMQQFSYGGRAGYAEGGSPEDEMELKNEFNYNRKRNEMEDLLDEYQRFKMRKDYQRRYPRDEARNGGRMGYAIGSTQQPMQMQSGQKMPPAMLTNQVTQRIMKDPRTMGNLMKDPKFLNILNSIKNKRASSNANSQGRQGYRYGSPPVRTNQAGITELDYRQKGGFVPPIGVKEKADDIPAMLSNNEFVFTANAVRNAGGGSVKEGAKKMYGLMRQLEGRS
jgi:hypothetical protein